MGLPDPEQVLKDSRLDDDEEEEHEQLPPTDAISIDVRDSRGKRYKGTFLFTVPDIGTQIEIGKMKAAYLPQGSAPDPNALTLVEIVCFLTATLTFNEQFPKPSWWNPMKAYSAEPYTALYGRCLEYEARFHGERKEPQRDEGDAGESEDSGGDAGRRAAGLGGEVRPPAKRPETLAGDGA